MGALFGAFFSVSKYELEVRYGTDREQQTAVVSNWTSMEFFRSDTVSVARFGPEDQTRIVQYVRSISATERRSLTVWVSSKHDSGTEIAKSRERFDQLQSIKKVKSLAALIKPVGTVFIRLLMFAAIPLVLASLLVGAASLGDIKHVGRMGGKTLLWYLATITMSIAIGLVLVNLIQPGTRLAPSAKEALVSEYRPDIGGGIASPDLVQMLVNIVATNPINALASGEMLQIVFFALMLGVSLTLVPADKSRPVISFLEG